MAVEAAFRNGWQRIKLYFMIGLPTETDEDVLGIADLATKVAQMGRRMGARPTIGVSVSSLTPKPHTPFQWRAQDSIAEIERKQSLLRGAIRSRDISLSWHDARSSRLEAVLSRGDRRLGKAIHLAWRKGCRFDAWSEHFRYDLWMAAISESGLDPDFYANRRREWTEVLPWDHINCGVTKDFLIAEDRRADACEVTSDCRLGECHNCGVSRMADCPKRDAVPVASGEAASVREARPAMGGSERVRMLLSMRKGEEIKYLSHRDYVHAFELALRRARLRIAYSEGFNPRPKMVFGSAIGVGVTSEDERIQVELCAAIDPLAVRDALNAVLPRGMEVRDAQICAEGEKSPLSGMNLSQFRMSAFCPHGCDPSCIDRALEGMLAAQTIPVIREKDGVRKEVDIVCVCSPPVARTLIRMTARWSRWLWIPVGLAQGISSMR